MSEEKQAVTMMDAPIYLGYNFKPCESASHFLSNLKQGKIVGMRRVNGDEVYVPPRGSCPKYGEPITVPVELSDKGTVESFTIVHIPIPGNPIKPPFVVANILVDGAALSFIHLVSGVDNADVRIGMRVQAEWKPEEEWDYSFENVKYFKPIDEPDVDVDALREQHNA
ncbi:MAG: Zn-ribbon domain-containing OB-fold protein [Pseudomonadales bacterium]